VKFVKFVWFFRKLEVCLKFVGLFVSLEVCLEVCEVCFEVCFEVCEV